MSEGHRINRRITAPKVRLVDADGVNQGVVTIEEALSAADSADLDLVEVAPGANPPVCRVIDYKRWQYEQSQKAKTVSRSSTALKEMKYRLKIGDADFETKTRKVKAFLAGGHPVKVTIMFRGREQSRPEMGVFMLDRITDALRDVGRIDNTPRRDGRDMTLMFIPVR